MGFDKNYPKTFEISRSSPLNRHADSGCATCHHHRHRHPSQLSRLLAVTTCCSVIAAAALIPVGVISATPVETGLWEHAEPCFAARGRCGGKRAAGPRQCGVDGSGAPGGRGPVPLHGFGLHHPRRSAVEDPRSGGLHCGAIDQACARPEVRRSFRMTRVNNLNRDCRRRTCCLKLGIMIVPLHATHCPYCGGMQYIRVCANVMRVSLQQGGVRESAGHGR